MRIAGLDHVQLAMPAGLAHEAEARAFYGGVLGMTEAPKPEPLIGRGGCWFEAPGAVLHVGVEADFTPARKAHPAFLVEDLKAAHETLRRAGAPVTSDDTLPDVRRVYTADPFGNRIELIQAGDGFTERSAVACGTDATRTASV
ncbi:MAG: VOC family protein [Dehalococcoidia bacterium]